MTALYRACTSPYRQSACQHLQPTATNVPAMWHALPPCPLPKGDAANPHLADIFPHHSVSFVPPATRLAPAGDTPTHRSAAVCFRRAAENGSRCSPRRASSAVTLGKPLPFSTQHSAAADGDTEVRLRDSSAEWTGCWWWCRPGTLRGRSVAVNGRIPCEYLLA